jgi:chromate transporter
MRDDVLLGLVMVFVPFSLISIGGGASIIAGMESEVVTAHGWLTSKEFVELFAISRAAPGPGTMLATLIGWKVAGWTGALVASLSLFLPSSLLCYTVFRLSNAHRERPWHRAMREGLAPVGTGLIIAGVMSILRLTGGEVSSVLIALASAGLLIAFPRLPPLAIIGAGGCITWALYEYGFSGA